MSVVLMPLGRSGAERCSSRWFPRRVRLVRRRLTVTAAPGRDDHLTHRAGGLGTHGGREGAGAAAPCFPDKGAAGVPRDSAGLRLQPGGGRGVGQTDVGLL